MASRHDQGRTGGGPAAPAPRRPASRTRWPAWKVLLYVAAELALVGLAVAGLILLLAHS